MWDEIALWKIELSKTNKYYKRWLVQELRSRNKRLAAILKFDLMRIKT
jgi:hypothetical protein